MGFLVPSWDRKGKDEADQCSLLDDFFLIIRLLLKGLYTYKRWDLRDTEKLWDRISMRGLITSAVLGSLLSLSPICHTGRSHRQPDPAAQVCWIFEERLERLWGLMCGLLSFRKANTWPWEAPDQHLSGEQSGAWRLPGHAAVSRTSTRENCGCMNAGRRNQFTFYSCFLLLLLFWMNEWWPIAVAAVCSSGKRYGKCRYPCAGGNKCQVADPYQQGRNHQFSVLLTHVLSSTLRVNLVTFPWPFLGTSWLQWQ